MKCKCGKELNLKTDTLLTRFAKTEIKVINSPYYECGSGHMKTARRDRVKLKKLLSDAHDKGETVCDFNDA